MMQTLTVRDLARVLVAARVEMLSAESTLNALNVFPVPDGDTGTNMRVTLEAGLDALAEDSGSDGDRAGLRRVVAAMTRGAQGNSGVILSEYVRGFVREITTSKRLVPGERGLEFDGRALAAALASAAAAARGAVHEPVDGTILSVADQASRAGGLLEGEAEHAGAHAGVGAVAQVAFDAARHALERTPQQLEALADSNVIDAGAAGLVLVLESLARVAAGRGGLPRVSERSWLRPRGGALQAVGGCHAEIDGPAFEVIAVVDGMDEETAAILRARLGSIGDSVVVAGGGGVHRAHVHTDAVLTVVSRLREAGEVSALQITRFDGALSALASLVVIARDPAVREYASSVGAVAQEPGAEAGTGRNGDKDSVDMTRIVLADSDLPDAVTTHVVGLLHELEYRVAWATAAQAEGDGEGLLGEGSGDTADAEPAADHHHAPEDLVSEGSRPADPWDDDAWGDDLCEEDAFVEVLRADSWRAARDLARLHLDQAEAVLVCVDPHAERHAAQTLLDLVRDEAGASADVEHLRLESGSLVMFEVIHG